MDANPAPSPAIGLTSIRTLDAQYSLLPNALKHGFNSRHFGNRSFYG